MKRDADTHKKLLAQGWRIGRIWECALKGKTRRPLGEVLDMCATWLFGDQPETEIKGL